jgi:hypothetical protein
MKFKSVRLFIIVKLLPDRLVKKLSICRVNTAGMSFVAGGGKKVLSDK